MTYHYDEFDQSLKSDLVENFKFNTKAKRKGKARDRQKKKEV